MGSATGPSRHSSSYKSRKWYSYIEWSVSYPNNTQATISATLYFRGNKDTWGQVGKYCSGSITINGSTSSFKAGSQSWLFSNITSKKVLSYSVTINRTTGQQNISISGSVNLSSSSAYHSSSGASTASGIQTVDARPWYTVTFNGNGGTSSSATVYYGYTTTFPTTSRTGYTFNKWNGTYNAGATTPTITGNTTYTAYWNPNLYIYTYQPSFDAIGSTFTQDKYHDISVLLAKQGFTKDYYYLRRWKYKLNENDQNDTYADLNSTCNVNQNLTIYPVFAPNTVTMSYYSDGEEYDTNNQQVVAYNEDSAQDKITLKQPNSLSPTPIKTGYHIGAKEWSINTLLFNSGDELNWLDYGQSNVSNTVIRADLQWEANTYKVSYSTNGGSFDEEVPDINVTYDKSFTLTDKTPTRKGYKFIEWQDSLDSTKTYQPGQTITDNLTAENNGTITLVAQWELIINRIQITDYEFDRATDGTINSTGREMIGNIHYYPGHYWDEVNQIEISFDFETLESKNTASDLRRIENLSTSGEYISCEGETAINENITYYTYNDNTDEYEAVLNPDINDIENYFIKQGYFKEILRQSEKEKYVKYQGETLDPNTTYYIYNDNTDKYEEVLNSTIADINEYFIFTTDYIDYNEKRLIKFQTFRYDNWNTELEISEAQSYQVIFNEIFDNPGNSIEPQSYIIIESTQTYKISPVSFIIDINKTGDKIAFGGPSDDTLNNEKGIYIAMGNSLYMILDDQASPEVLGDGSIKKSLEDLEWDIDVLVPTI